MNHIGCIFVSAIEKQTIAERKSKNPIQPSSFQYPSKNQNQNPKPML